MAKTKMAATSYNAHDLALVKGQKLQKYAKWKKVNGEWRLAKIKCVNAELSEHLDLSDCTALERLECNDNQLTSLNVSGCEALDTLYCNNNVLTTLNVSGCKALKVRD